MHWNLEISVGNILTALTLCGTMIGGILKLVQRIDRILGLLQDFPPHRHAGDDIVYPKGLEPAPIETRAAVHGALILFACLGLLLPAARAQTPTYILPQSVTATKFFNSVSTAQTSTAFSNLGQTVHLLFYQATGSNANPTGVQIRLEGSFDGATFIPISDDGTDPPNSGFNLVMAIGPYPYVRANLVKCVGCNGVNTITASYIGSSSMPGNPFGTYGAGQQIRKIMFANQSTDGNATSPTIVGPYGSTAGMVLLFTVSGAFPSGSTISANTVDANGVQDAVANYNIPTGASIIAFPIPASPGNSIQLTYGSGGVVSRNFFAWYLFYPPGTALPSGAQPSFTANSETTATNAAATITLTTDGLIQRGHLFAVNARCSAGTATLTVKDGTTQIWSSGTGEVGTASFTKTWTLGLASSPSKNLVVSLSTCGAANVGTLDVQGSVF